MPPARRCRVWLRPALEGYQRTDQLVREERWQEWLDAVGRRDRRVIPSRFRQGTRVVVRNPRAPLRPRPWPIVRPRTAADKFKDGVSRLSSELWFAYVVTHYREPDEVELQRRSMQIMLLARQERCPYDPATVLRHARESRNEADLELHRALAILGTDVQWQCIERALSLTNFGLDWD